MLLADHRRGTNPGRNGRGLQMAAYILVPARPQLLGPKLTLCPRRRRESLPLLGPWLCIYRTTLGERQDPTAEAQRQLGPGL